MAQDTVLEVRMGQKYDLEANWVSNNPVLKGGEIGFSISFPNDDTTQPAIVKMKIGDGIKTYTHLPFVQGDMDIEWGEF